MHGFGKLPKEVSRQGGVVTYKFEQNDLINKNNLLHVERVINIKDLFNKIGLNIEPINKVYFTSSYQSQTHLILVI